MSGTSEEGAAPERGIDRRSLIKRAAAAGAVAWTAPLVIDSFASPAAAATFATGCYRTQRSRNGCGGQPVSDSNAGCNPPGWAGAALYPGTVTVVGACPAPGTNANTVFQIPADTNCVFVRGQITGAGLFLCIGGGCINGTLSNANKRITFAGPKCNLDNSAYRLLISCGGATC